MKQHEEGQDNAVAENASWNFSGQTAENFDEHVRRSVPMYETGHDLICKLSDFFVRSDSLSYEIGVSTGRLLAKLVQHHQHKVGCKWIGIDAEQDMIAQALENLDGRKGVFVEAVDIVSYPLEKSDLIVSYYCIQFIPPKFRQDVITKIYKALNWGGAFIWFEKVRGCDARFQDILTTLYTDYKLEQQFSPSEIIGKTRSLKGVLEPFSSQGNMDLLKRAGFVDMLVVFKYLCFEGVLAIK